MADDDTQTAAPAAPAGGGDLAGFIKQYLEATKTPPPVQPDTTPVSRGWLSLLGEGIGGGSQIPMSPADKEQAGLRALLGFGTGLMGAAHYSPGATVFSNLAQGIEGGQRGLLSSEQMSAAKLGAQQDYQLGQRKMTLEGLKDALPLLQMQQGMNLPNPLADRSPAPGGPPGSAPDTYEGAIGAIEGPGKNPNSSSSGFGGFLDGTWRDFAAANPDLFKGMTPAQVMATKSDPAFGNKAISWLAQKNAGDLSKAGIAPSGMSLGIAHYIGSGPAAAVMGAPDNAPIKNFVSDAAVKANPDFATMTVGQMKQRYAGVPNPGFLNPASPNKFAGAGVPTGGAPTAPPPAVPMKETYTLGPDGKPVKTTVPVTPAPAAPAPGGVVDQGELPGASPAPTAPAVAAAPSGGGTGVATPPPAATPPGGQTLEEFITQHMPKPTPEEAATWHQAPDQATLQRAQAERDAATQQLSYARGRYGVGSKEANDALTRFNATDKDLSSLQQKYSETNATALNDWNNKNKALLVPLYQNQVNQAQLAQENQRNRDATAALKTQEGQQAIELANVNSGNKVNADFQTEITTDMKNMGTRIDDLQLLRGLSDNLGSPTALTSFKFGGRSLADIISAAGLGPDSLKTKAGQAQAYRAATLSVIRDLRAGGAAAGEPRSNQDLQFVTDMAPSEWEDPNTRTAITSFLQQVAQRRYDLGAETTRQMTNRLPNGQPMPGALAYDAARAKLPDMVPKLPEGGDVAGPVQDKFFGGLRPYTFFRKPNGGMALYTARNRPVPQ